jgi:hypothetical protein
MREGPESVSDRCVSPMSPHFGSELLTPTYPDQAITHPAGFPDAGLLFYEHFTMLPGPGRGLSGHAGT